MSLLTVIQKRPQVVPCRESNRRGFSRSTGYPNNSASEWQLFSISSSIDYAILVTRKAPLAPNFGESALRKHYLGLLFRVWVDVQQSAQSYCYGLVIFIPENLP